MKGHPAWNKDKKGVYSQETLNKMSIAKKGKVTWMKGKHFTDEQKQKISNSKKGYKASEETRRKMSNSHKGIFTGSKSPNWKGGRNKSGGGYIMIYQPQHPYNIKNYIFEHRLIMEKIIGRYLTENEIVHHKNGIRDDNRFENLMLVIKNKNWHPHICPKCKFEFLIK